MRSSNEAYIGDTVYKSNTIVEPLESFSVPKPMVFAGVYPFDQSQHVSLRSAIEKLTLNDSAVSVSIDSRYYANILFHLSLFKIVLHWGKVFV